MKILIGFLVAVGLVVLIQYLRLRKAVAGAIESFTNDNAADGEGIQFGNVYYPFSGSVTKANGNTEKEIHFILFPNS